MFTSLNPLMLLVTKWSAFSCRFVQVCVTFLLPPGIKGLIKYGSSIQILDFCHCNTLTKNNDHGSNGTNMCLLIIYLFIFFYLLFIHAKYNTVKYKLLLAVFCHKNLSAFKILFASDFLLRIFFK